MYDNMSDLTLLLDNGICWDELFMFSHVGNSVVVQHRLQHLVCLTKNSFSAEGNMHCRTQ